MNEFIRKSMGYWNDLKMDDLLKEFRRTRDVDLLLLKIDPILKIMCENVANKIKIQGIEIPSVLQVNCRNMLRLLVTQNFKISDDNFSSFYAETGRFYHCNKPSSKPQRPKVEASAGPHPSRVKTIKHELSDKEKIKSLKKLRKMDLVSWREHDVQKQELSVERRKSEVILLDEWIQRNK